MYSPLNTDSFVENVAFRLYVGSTFKGQYGGPLINNLYIFQLFFMRMLFCLPFISQWITWLVELPIIFHVNTLWRCHVSIVLGMCLIRILHDILWFTRVIYLQFYHVYHSNSNSKWHLPKACHYRTIIIQHTGGWNRLSECSLTKFWA